jgi:hypothetical protein
VIIFQLPNWFSCLFNSANRFTLFFGGNTFAPGVTAFGIEGGATIQDFLQLHYINAMKLVANALKAETNVVGFDTLNEPNNG